MSKLSTGARKKLPGKDFAGPGRSFPIEDKEHARAALIDEGRDKSLTVKEAARIRAAALKKLRGK